MRNGRRLAGQVAIVSGAGRGIGRAVAARLADDGAAVVCLDLEGAAETAGAVAGSGGESVAVLGDVAEEATWGEAMAAAHERWGAVTILANVAGIHLHQDTVLETGPADFDRTLAVNLRGPWLGMAAVLPDMLDAGSGAIVNVTSSAASQGVPNHAAYSASKGGLESLTRQVAVEYAGRGIRANSIAPGAIETPLLETNSPETNAEIAAATPAGSFGTPSEVAALVSFLAAPEVTYVVGTVIPVDGGLTAG